MLIAATESEERITTAHRAKLAYVYVRQSTAGQVRQHQESTQLQYRLVERAALLGWPRDRIEVIDDDLGNRAHRVTRAMAFSGSLPRSVWARLASC